MENLIYQKRVTAKDDEKFYEYPPMIKLTEEVNCFIIWHYDESGKTTVQEVLFSHERFRAIERAVDLARDFINIADEDLKKIKGER